MKSKSLRYRGVSRIAIGQSRRISLPKYFKVSLPFYIVGLTYTSDNSQFLAICGSSVLPQLRADLGERFCVFSEHRTSRTTLPRAICEKFSLLPGTNAVLIGKGNYLDLCSKKTWDDLLGQLPDGEL